MLRINYPTHSRRSSTLATLKRNLPSHKATDSKYSHFVFISPTSSTFIGQRSCPLNPQAQRQFSQCKQEIFSIGTFGLPQFCENTRRSPTRQPFRLTTHRSTHQTVSASLPTNCYSSAKVKSRIQSLTTKLQKCRPERSLRAREPLSRLSLASTPSTCTREYVYLEGIREEEYRPWLFGRESWNFGNATRFADGISTFQLHGATFKKRAPKAIKEIKEFAHKTMVRY